MRVNWYNLFFISTVPKQTESMCSFTPHFTQGGPTLDSGTNGGLDQFKVLMRALWEVLLWKELIGRKTILSCTTSQSGFGQCHIHSTAARTGRLIPFTHQDRNDGETHLYSDDQGLVGKEGVSACPPPPELLPPQLDFLSLFCFCLKVEIKPVLAGKLND